MTERKSPELTITLDELARISVTLSEAGAAFRREFTPDPGETPRAPREPDGWRHLARIADWVSKQLGRLSPEEQREWSGAIRRAATTDRDEEL